MMPLPTKMTTPVTTHGVGTPKRFAASANPMMSTVYPTR